MYLPRLNLAPHTTTPICAGPPPGLNEGDEPYYVPPVPGFAHPENPWKDLLPVRTAFSAEHDGFYTLCNMEPAFITKDTTGLDADQVLPISSVKLLADYEVRASVFDLIDWFD